VFFLFSGEVDIVKNDKRVACLQAPCAFGEKALESNVKRLATIRAVGKVDCLVLMKRDYDTIMREEINHKIELNLKFIKRISFFFTWTNERIQKLINVIGEIQYKPRDCLWKQGDESDYVYILKSGVLFSESILTKTDFNFYPVNTKEWEVVKTERLLTYLHQRIEIGEIFGFDEILTSSERKT